MSWIDWLIVLTGVAFVVGVGLYSRRYIRSVADYLAAGRICGRYVLSAANVAQGLGIITLVAYVEVHYKTGFALGFWQTVQAPLLVILSLTGFCYYRFRETKAMSLGQFLEIRYNRAFRVFASGLRSISEILANVILPAIAARFFIYFLDLPHTVTIFTWQCPTYALVVLGCLILSLSFIFMGGTLTLIITDSIQGLICYPMLVIFIVFLLMKFSWSGEIVEVLHDRVTGESFLNPYDISKLRDFNLFFLGVTFLSLFLNYGNWLGESGSTAAKSPHEQKMAGILGNWRGMLNMIFYAVIALSLTTLLTHPHFADKAQKIRSDVACKITKEIILDPAMQAKITTDMSRIPAEKHVIGKDPARSQEENPDTVYFIAAQKNLASVENGNFYLLEFKTLFRQLLLPMSMRQMLPVGLFGMFCFMMIIFMISTDDSRIYSSALTITQDCVVPFLKKLPLERHIFLIRLISLAVGVIYFIGSFFMAQLDYINLFVAIMSIMWAGGAGPVIVFGLYSRFGTTAGAFASLTSGMLMSLGGIAIQRNWADHVFPFLTSMQWDLPVGHFLAVVSKPFNPYIVWEMNPEKCPVNSYEIFFITMILSLTLYVVVSLLTCREPFNLDRMLYRGRYALGDECQIRQRWTWKHLMSTLIGITPEYTRGDKIITWSVFIYSFVYKLGIMFLLVIVWNIISPWKIEWWGVYFFILLLGVPSVAALVTTFWFGIGGVIDLFRLFHDLRTRVVNVRDNGQVEGHMSLADKDQLEAVDRKIEESRRPNR